MMNKKVALSDITVVWLSYNIYKISTILEARRKLIVST